MTAALTMLVGLVLLLAPALVAPVLLGIRGPMARVVVGLIAAAAELVLITEVVSLFDALRTGWVLLAQLLAAVAFGLAWLRAGRPSLALGLPRPAAVARSARAEPIAAVAVAVALIGLLCAAVVAVIVAPNNSDSMTYHLARIAFWLQFDSVLHFDLGSDRQLAQPPNAEFIQGWTVMLSDSDRFAALVQTTAAAGLGLTVALGARLLGFARSAAAFAGALFVILPQPLLQASSTQNDVIAAFLMLAGMVFVARGVRDRHLGELAAGAAALALAIGTKGTTLIAGPSLLLLLAGIVIGYRPSWSLLLRGAAVGAVSIALLGAFNYVLNYDTYSDPLGPLNDVTARQDPVEENAVRVAWSFVDSPGVQISWLSRGFSRVGEALFEGVKDERFVSFAMDTTVQEDLSSYGLFGLLVFLPLLVLVLCWPGIPAAWRLVAGSALLYFAVFAITTDENPFIGRVLMPGVAIGAPLIAILYRRRVLSALALALALVAVPALLIENNSKPWFAIADRPSVFSQTRIEQQTNNRRDLRPVIGELGARVPPDAPLGLVHSGISWDYLFFGPDRDRRIELFAPGEVTPDTARDEGLAGIVFSGIEPPPELDAEVLGEPSDEEIESTWFVPAR